jgi:cytochrome P450
MRALWQQYGDCYRVPSESREADSYVINHPDWVRRVLVSNHRNYTKGVGIERVRVLLGNGLMTSEGERWRRQRRMLQPGFHRPRIEAFFPIYFRQAQALVERWQRAGVQGEAVNITAEASETTLAAVLQALFSEDLPAADAGLHANPFDLVSRESRRDLQFAMRFRALGRVVQDIAEQRRREARFPPDLLSHCLQARDKSSGAPMSDKQLVDEVLTLLVAGHETTAASLNWLWYLLALHPAVYQRVAAEARGLALTKAPDWQQLNDLVWIPRVIKEALRLYPPGWLYTRRALDEDRFGAYRIPAGADVFVCSYLLHRHPQFWDDVEAFRPERFAPEADALRHPFAYLPFSAGPRHCIGERFAMAEMMIHLAIVAARLRPGVPAAAELELETEVNLRPRRPLYLHFEAQD